jgi:prepilin-type N-terminal cleavage/methylation domain-containing protein
MKKGFTLIELLLIIAILAVLATMAFLFLNPFEQFKKGHDSRRRSDLAQIKIAFENYYEDKGCYPPATSLNNCGGTNLAPYLKIIPCDPVTKLPYTYVPDNTMTSTCIQNFAIFAEPEITTHPAAHEFTTSPTNPEQNTCAKFVVRSEAMAYNKIIQACSGEGSCNRYYGCVNGQCVVIANDNLPPCSPSYCSSDCGAVDCNSPRNTCVYF